MEGIQLQSTPKNAVNISYYNYYTTRLGLEVSFTFKVRKMFSASC